MASKTVIVIAAVVAVIIIVFAAYAGLTYPRTIVTIPVSFTRGTDTTNTQFDQSSLDGMVEVQVSIQSGTALWRARILSGDQIVWEHTALQGEQQSYNSGWMTLASGTYNFTFGIVGGDSLDATVTVTSKGGFWRKALNIKNAMAWR